MKLSKFLSHGRQVVRALSESLLRMSKKRQNFRWVIKDFVVSFPHVLLFFFLQSVSKENNTKIFCSSFSSRINIHFISDYDCDFWLLLVFSALFPFVAIFGRILLLFIFAQMKDKQNWNSIDKRRREKLNRS